MKRCGMTPLLVVTMTLGLISNSVAQSSDWPSNHELKGPFKITSYHPHQELTPELMRQISAGPELPLWLYTVTATQDDKAYMGMMVGRSPFFYGKIPIKIKTLAVGVIVTLGGCPDCGDDFDPTVLDPCLGDGTEPLTMRVHNSPILMPVPFAMNGADMGKVQYIDGYKRANFWELVKGTPYHTTLDPITESTAVPPPIPLGLWGTGTSKCHDEANKLAVVDLKFWDTVIAPILLALVGATPDENVMFYTRNVVFTPDGGKSIVLGYHNAVGTQTYSFSEVDTTTNFADKGILDFSIMANEIGEWMDDPLTTNPTPAWGHVGPVSGCQSKLEVGNPLTGTNFPAVDFMGFTYHLQELAFFSWFYGGDSLGAGGKYSNNGTFKSPSTLCASSLR